MRTLGADPELLFAYRETGTLASVQDRMPGTKEAPYLVEHGAIQADNVSGEFNIEPCTTHSEFSGKIKSVRSILIDILEAQGLAETRHSVGEYEETELTHPNACTSGCDPDWNAYTLQINDPPDYTTTRLRAAGGHIHIGYSFERQEIPEFVKVLDLLITVPMMVYDDPRRRTMYGKAGAFRLKPYGLEYRTPSNAWVFSDERCRWVCEQVDRALKDWRKYQLPHNLQEIIDTHRISELDTITSVYGILPFPQTV
jgi:hypothetical protein